MRERTAETQVLLVTKKEVAMIKREREKNYKEYCKRVRHKRMMRWFKKWALRKLRPIPQKIYGLGCLFFGMMAIYAEITCPEFFSEVGFTGLILIILGIGMITAKEDVFA